jgi:hypothetical protein
VSFQDSVIMLLVVGLVATWVFGARMIRRMASELDEFARDRVEHDELQTSVGRTLGQLQLAADNLADALATRTERLHELLAQADAQSAMLGEAIAVAATLAERLGAEGAAIRQISAAAQVLEPVYARSAVTVDPAGSSVPYLNGSATAATNGGAPVRDDSSWPAPIVPEPVSLDGPRSAVSAYRDEVGAEVAAAPASADEVRRLARDGMDLATIARRTNRGREEVRLLLRFAGAPGGADGRREQNGISGQATLTPGTFRRP